MRYHTSYITINQMLEEYRKAIREAERQSKYERSIVSSVLISEIPVNVSDVPTTEWWKPG